MKIAILSDIHGNDVALRAVLMELDKICIDKILFLGDYVGYYYNADIVLNLLKDCGNELIKGNHELFLKQSIENNENALAIKEKYGSGIEQAKNVLSSEQINYLINLPEKKEIIVDELKILICHGTPWDISEYLYPDSLEASKKKCLGSEANFVFIGHSHRSFIYEQGGKVLINVGSVGQNREVGGIASWGFLDTKRNIYTTKETCYDVNTLIKQVIRFDPDHKYLINVLRRKPN